MKLVRSALIWVLLALIASTAHAQEEELLEPDKAFSLRVEAVDAGTVKVTWDIADGYYMYRDKFGFQAAQGASVTGVEYPEGKIKRDEFFGDVEVYVHRAAFDVALANTASKVKLVLEGQGCNEPVGVC
ncbi:MAG: thiol:disulfide interchange protein, partial [Proteobacteria bacterium]